MHKQHSWEDIPSLDGLEIDWDFKVESPMGKRAHSRLSIEKLSQLYKVSDIPVKLVTEKEQCTASLLDLSQGGVCLKADLSNAEISQLVKFGFILGGHKMISRGRIKYVRKEQDCTILGIEFVGLMGDNQEYIAQLYSSIHL